MWSTLAMSSFGLLGWIPRTRQAKTVDVLWEKGRRNGRSMGTGKMRRSSRKEENGEEEEGTEVGREKKRLRETETPRDRPAAVRPSPVSIEEPDSRSVKS